MKRKEALKLMEQITDGLKEAYEANKLQEALYWLGMADCIEYMLDTDPALDAAYDAMGFAMQCALDKFDLNAWYRKNGPVY